MSHAALVHLARFGMFGVRTALERFKSRRRTNRMEILQRRWVSYRKEEWCFSVGAQRYGSIKVTLYSFRRAAWTNSRCSRPISLQTHGRNHMSHTAFLIIPHVILLPYKDANPPKEFWKRKNYGNTTTSHFCGEDSSSSSSSSATSFI